MSLEQNIAPEESRENDTPELTALELGEEIFQFLDGKKALDLRLLNLEEVNSYFNYFLLATATSQVHLRSLVRDIQKNYGAYMPSKEIASRNDEVESGWVVIDFIDLVIHIFIDEQRKFYNLERLWGDAEVVRP